MPTPFTIVGQNSNAHEQEHGHDHAHGDSCGIVAHATAASLPLPSAQFQGRAAVITLGCAKNHVDSEVMLGVLRNSGFEIVDDVASAEVAIINTCGFLQSAVKESIDCVLDVAEYKKKGSLRSLIVAGCAVERYREELQRSLPEVDIFLTTQDLLEVGQAAKQGTTIADETADFSAEQKDLSKLLTRSGRPYFLYNESSPRMLATKKHMAYVKVSEGCNRPCTFCIIPKIRGSMRSRGIDSIRREVEDLALQGVQEVNLVAQDLTSFGTDRKDGEDLAKLLHALNNDGAVPWIRLLYAYPVGTSDELLDAIVTLPHVVKYLDIPLQHSSEEVLKMMKRPLGKFSPRALVEKIKSGWPQISVRTTFIVGFPGETKAHADELTQFVSEGWFSNVGVFCYSLEEGTESFAMEGHLSEREKNARRGKVMAAQQKVVAKNASTLIGKSFDVLVDGIHEESDLLLSGRTSFQAPEVDGTVIINEIHGEGGDEGLAAQGLVGKIVPVKITEVAGYDLVGCVNIRESRHE